jgi:hypothetical protein
MSDVWVMVVCGGLDGCANCGCYLPFEAGSVSFLLFVVYAL